ncbi:gamma-glutamyltransferase family protein [Mycobacterium sp. 236(2023)]|uniref:gamma-glutamyltransferase family protein n=1 Tax=Mycobacterium sp. 236(2023) TaxID=3038163 RepID=UPI002414D543|nr:gamma-glutamyltransferase family protein [Mycobacterium sp. 236(2023)]MDG4663777.1 gamma-glutamyltransferase family protein [Mycobacterium sp. 236(2023)]
MTQAGMVAASHPAAVEAAVTILEEGGTAADAAVAASAMLTVVDPRSTGVGGDMFALYWDVDATEPVGLAAVGGAPAGMTVQALREQGFDSMPADGPWTVTVPGATWGWTDLLERYGRVGAERILRPAIEAARSGFAVPPIIAEEWKLGEDKLRRNPAAAAVFLPGDHVPNAGDTFVNAGLADALESYVAEGHAPFYTGDIAAGFADAVEALGGPLRRSDLAGWAGPEWSAPIRGSFRGMDIYEMPPPGQGLVVLEAARLYEELPLTSPGEADHHLIECMKIAFADAADHVADPRFHPVRVADLLDEERLNKVRSQIASEASFANGPGVPSDTVYVCVVDRSGAACSLIQSLYESFGSGVMAPGSGVLLHNRGNGFTLRDGHPNRPEGGKRPYHTIIPAMLGDATGFRGCLGIVGGFMQPQGQLQILRNVFDRGMSAQQALDAPRLRVMRGRAVGLEAGYDNATATELARRGHEITELPRFECGGAQMILRTETGLQGGSDRRKDGHVGVC